MPSLTTFNSITEVQRGILAHALHALLQGFERQRASQLQGLSQVERASQRLLQDADDATQRAGDHEVEASASDIDSAEIESISRALQHVYDADYGLCVDCEAAIPFARLEVEPQAIRCTACAAAHEQAS